MSQILGSKSWANSQVSWLVNFLKEDTWNSRLYLKIIVARSIAEDLKIRGYHWQSRRCLNQLHLFLKKHRDFNVSVRVSCTRAGLDPALARTRDSLDRREREIS